MPKLARARNTKVEQVEVESKTTSKGKYGSPASLKRRGKSVWHHVTYSPVNRKSVKIALTKAEAIKLAARLIELATSDQIVDHKSGAILVTARKGGCGSIIGRLKNARKGRARTKA